MPRLTSDIQELNDHIIDPILRQVAQRMIHTLNLQNVFNDNIIIKTKYSSISDTTDGDMNARLRESRFVMDVTIQQHPTNTKWDVTTFSHTPAYGIGNNINRNYPIFNDREFGIGLYEQAAPCSLMMQCTMHFKDKSLAYSVPLKLFNTYREGSVFQVTDLFYDYKLPNEIIYVLGEIYNKKEYTRKFETFYQYLQYWSGNKISMNKSRYADRPELVVKKHTAECLTSVEYADDEPGAENTDTSPNSFTVSFVMTVQFNMPNTNILVYPILIENKLLPIEAMPIPMSIKDKITYASMPDSGIDDYFQAYKQVHTEYIQLPYYDDWIVPPVCTARAYTQSPFFIAACTIDEGEEYNNIDLKTTLGEDFMLPTVVQAIIRRQEEIKKGGTFNPDCIFNISVYYGDEALPNNALSMTDLVMSYKGRKLNLVYHLVISEITDIRKLDPIYYPILVEFSDFLNATIVKQMWYLVNNGKGFTFTSSRNENDQWWIDADGNVYDIRTGKWLGKIDSTGSWTDADGIRHIGTLTNTLEASHGSGIISRVLRANIVTAKRQR